MRAAELQTGFRGEIEANAEAEGTTFDPVCGQSLHADGLLTVRLVHHGQTFHFCSEGCRERFERLAERVRVGEVLKMGALFAPNEKVRWGVA
jgi:YHS domain-containing protein